MGVRDLAQARLLATKAGPAASWPAPKTCYSKAGPAIGEPALDGSNAMTNQFATNQFARLAAFAAAAAAIAAAAPGLAQKAPPMHAGTGMPYCSSTVKDKCIQRSDAQRIDREKAAAAKAAG